MQYQVSGRVQGTSCLGYQPSHQQCSRRRAFICAAQKRSVIILPGLGNSTKDYEPLQNLLREKGLVVETASVSRPDWLRNAAGVLDGNYWKGTLNPRPVVDWYLHRVDDAMKRTGEQTSGGPITLLAHSAGGWLGRIYLLGFGTQDRVDRFISLGSPHLPPLKGSKAVDQTRGILTHVEDNCPGCFHSDVDFSKSTSHLPHSAATSMYNDDADSNYHCELNVSHVVGRFVKGARFGDKNSSWGQKICGLGYQQVCGEAEVWGDGVVPEPSALLPGALQITLENVYHSPVGSKDGVGDKKGRLWYGSLGVIDQWIDYIQGEANPKESRLVQAEELPSV